MSAKVRIEVGGDSAEETINDLSGWIPEPG
jgi:hypothetical protein